MFLCTVILVLESQLFWRFLVFKGKIVFGGLLMKVMKALSPSSLEEMELDENKWKLIIVICEGWEESICDQYVLSS